MPSKKLSQIGELNLLKELQKRFKKGQHNILIGIGDDAALLKPPKEDILLTTDMMVEGVHFDMDYITPYQLGFKLVSINVSDIYAMGGTPRFLLLNLAMNKNTSKKVYDSFFNGVEKAIHYYKVSLVGGDISSTNIGMTLSATIIGHAKKHIRRSGAKVGDKIYVTGNLGDSACGLALLKNIKTPIPLEKTNILHSKLLAKELKWKDTEPLLRRHLLPLARNPKRYVKYATSMIDISDGLLIDLSRICDESKVGARVFIRNIPTSPGLKIAASYLGISPIRLALSGGEDYELLFTAKENKKIRAIYIGDITESERVVIDISGRKRAFSAEGYQHFGAYR
ncbi:MAG: thiamine-phosphate kinase [Nitrospirae bacterium]|nr:thiamine-phosphate kinase [Nitrospirota bacterium]